MSVLAYNSARRPGSETTAILLHPHPDMGGNRLHPVIDALYTGLPLSTLRFDFSASDVDIALGEVDEALRLIPQGDVVLVGYSFGADIALGVLDARILGWLLIAPPLRFIDPGQVAAGVDHRPKRLLVPQYDQFCPPDRADEATVDWRSTSVQTLPGVDHFLVGAADRVLDAAITWSDDLITPR